jgi:hypothetical protein
MLIGPDGRQINAPERVEVEASELTPDENFFILCLRAMQPGASPDTLTEYRMALLGAGGDKAVERRRDNGLRSLMARGFIDYERLEDGRLRLDAAGQPSYVVKGRVVARFQHIDPRKMGA